MYGTNGGLVRCFAINLIKNVTELNVKANTLDECTLQISKGEGAYTIIPIYSGSKLASRWKEHRSRMIESCTLLNIPNSEIFCAQDNDEVIFRYECINATK